MTQITDGPLWRKQGATYVSAPVGDSPLNCTEASEGVLPVGGCTAHGDYDLSTYGGVFDGGAAVLRIEVYYRYGADIPYAGDLLATYEEEVVLEVIRESP
jgi:hypothetical protein